MENIQTKRTRLRRFCDSDLKNMIRLESDPEIMKWTPSRIPQSIEKIEARLKSLIEKQATHSPLGVWAVELQGTQEFIGWFMLVKTEFEVPEIGFMFVREFWGKGFATEVAQALIDFATNQLKYPAVAAVTDHNNAASIRVLKKLGFQKVQSRLRMDKVLNQEIEASIFELRKSF